jgi:surface antigen
LEQQQRENLMPESSTLKWVKNLLAERGLGTRAEAIHDAMLKTPSCQDLNDITIEEQTGKAVIKTDALETEQEAAPVPSNTAAETSKPKDNFMPITRAHRQAYERAVQLGETLPGTMKRWLQLQGIIKHALSPEPPARRKILEPKSQKPVDATETPIRGLNSIGQSNNKFTPIHTAAETSKPMENFIPITRSHRHAYERAVQFGETLPGTMKPPAAPANDSITTPSVLHHQAKPATKAAARRSRRKQLQELFKQQHREKLIPESSTLQEVTNVLAERGFIIATPAEAMHDAMFKTPSHQDLNDIAGEEQTGQAVIKADALETEQEAAPVPSNTAAETSKPKDNFMPITRAHRQAYERAVQLGETLPGTMKMWLQLQGIINQALSLESPATRKILEPKSRKSVDATEPQLRGLNSNGQSNDKFTQIANEAQAKSIRPQDGQLIGSRDVAPPVAAEPKPKPIPRTAYTATWRSKIRLSAVECEQEGVALPAPNFPFQQRQLQPYGGMNRGQKRKRDIERKIMQPWRREQ